LTVFGQDATIIVNGIDLESIADTEVYTEEDFDKSDETDLMDFIGTIAGVYFSQTGEGGFLYIRGFSSQRILVILDGLPITLSFLNSMNLSLSLIEKIIVYKGNLSALFGPDAMGGVIYIQTKNGKNTNLTKLDLYADSLLNFTASFFMSVFKNNAIQAYQFSITQNFNDYEDALGNNNFSDIYGKFFYSSDNLVCFDTVQYWDKQIPGNMQFPYSEAFISGASNVFSLTFQGWNLLSQTQWKIYNNEEYIYDIYEETVYQSFFINKTYHWDFFDFSFENLFEIYYLNSLEITDSFFGDKTIGKNRLSGRIFKNIVLDNGLSFLMALSLDSFFYLKSENEFSVVPSFYLNVSFPFYKGEENSVYFYFTAASAYRIPDFEEQFYASTIFMEGNELLDPEHSYELQMSFVFDFFPLKISISGYGNIVNDMIIWIPSINMQWKPENILEVANFGGELELLFLFLFKNGKSYFELYSSASWSFSYNLSEESGYQGLFLPYRPMEQYYIKVSYVVPGSVTLYSEFTYTGFRYTNFANTNYIDPYYILNTGLSFQFNERFSILFSVNNLFNQNYIDLLYYESPGIEFVLKTMLLF